MEHEGDAMVIPRRAKSMLGFLAGLLVLSGMLLFVRNAYMLTSPARRHLSRSASGPEPLVALAAADEASLVGAAGSTNSARRRLSPVRSRSRQLTRRR